MAKNQRAAPTVSALRRFTRLHGKLLIAAIAGLGVFALTPIGWQQPTRVLTSWDLGVALYLGLVQMTMARCDISRIRQRAAEQDEGALAILLLSMAATFASLIAIVFALGGTQPAPHGHALPLLLLAMATILLSWAFVHTIFALHYAHEYYGERRDGIIGGLEFPGDEAPDYWDFLYFSLVIAMTSQVSDVDITSKGIRRIATIHGVLSFFFNLVVLALTVNMVSNLI